MALNSKRMQTFFNEFLITTTTFINNFASDCENKFETLERKLYKIESNLTIIEAKLASVPSEDIPSSSLPDVESLKLADESREKQEKPSEPEKPDVPSAVSSNFEEITGQTVEQQPAVKNKIKICESFHYKTFFRMLKVGVPFPAVKIKMNAEGLDANLLDTPDALIERSPEDDEQE